MFLKNDALKIGDVGGALPMDVNTRASSTAGTPAYNPPEVFLEWGRSFSLETITKSGSEYNEYRALYTSKSDIW